MNRRPGGVAVGLGDGQSRVGWRPVVLTAFVALLALVAVTLTPSAASGQESADGAAVRIVARKLADGRVEFGLQQRDADNTWGERLLPRVRFFPTTAQVDSWLVSSALDLSVGAVRIVARKLADGRVEFGLQQRDADNTWGERLLPRVRFFPTTAQVDSWLVSSALTVSVAVDSTVVTTPAAGARFTAVSAGAGHSCVLRGDETVACWGNDLVGQASAPAGRFLAVAAGYSHSCGVRADSTLTCWGTNTHGEGGPPAGDFSAVTAMGVRGRAVQDGQTTREFDSRFSCGLRSDGTITCWGSNDEGQTNAPSGQFTSLSSGSAHSCGLRGDATIACWGDNQFEKAQAPAGTFTAVAAGGLHSCALRSNGTIGCWGQQRLRPNQRADGTVHRPQRRLGALLRRARRRHDCVLGT